MLQFDLEGATADKNFLALHRNEIESILWFRQWMDWGRNRIDNYVWINWETESGVSNGEREERGLREEIWDGIAKTKAI